MEPPHYCGQQTLSGNPCRQHVSNHNEKCWQHKGYICSICHLYMNGRKETRTLGCNHTFHMACICRWKNACIAKYATCPECRAPFDVPLFKCRLIIEKVSDQTIAIANFQISNIHSIINDFGIELNQPVENRIEIFFDIEQDENINDVLGDLNLPLHPDP
jgi:hypothetical protein